MQTLKYQIKRAEENDQYHIVAKGIGENKIREIWWHRNKKKRTS